MTNCGACDLGMPHEHAPGSTIKVGFMNDSHEFHRRNAQEHLLRWAENHELLPSDKLVIAGALIILERERDVPATTETQ